MSDDGKSTTDERSPASNKLDSMPKDGLVKLIQSQMLLKKKLEGRISELTTSNLSLCQSEEQLRNQLDDEQSKSKQTVVELEQFRGTQSKLQQELQVARESLECFGLQNDTLKSSCKNLQDEISNLQNELANTRSSFATIEEDLKNQVNHFQNTLDNLQNEKQAFEEEKTHSDQSMANLESMNSQLKAEIDHIRSQLAIQEGDRQAMEKDIADCREQIRDLELLKSEWTETQQSSLTSVSRSSDDDPNASISPADEHVPTLLSDVPTLLLSLGITDYSLDEIAPPFNLRSALYLCSLLVDRCRTLTKTSSSDNALTSATQTDGDEHDRMVIEGNEHLEFSELVNHISTWMNHSTDPQREEHVLSRYIDQNADPYIRLNFSDLKLISEQIERDLLTARGQLDELSKDNERQREQLVKLEEIKQQDKFANEEYDRVKQAFDELEQKYRLAEQWKVDNEVLGESVNQNEAQLQEQRELIDRLKIESEREHFHVLERDETIRLLRVEMEQHEKSKEDLIESHRLEVDELRNELERDKQAIENGTHQQDERYSSLVKQHQQLSELLEAKVNEAKQLAERNLQLQDDLKESRELLFDKTKQADDLDRQLRTVSEESEDVRAQYEQVKDEKHKLANEISSLIDQLEQLQAERTEDTKIIEKLREELESNQSNLKQTSEEQLKQTIEALKDETQVNRTAFAELQSRYEAEQQRIVDQQHEQTSVSHDLQSTVEKFQQDNEQLSFTIKELNDKLEHQTVQSNETIQDLKEKQQKMKVLLSRLKKELDEKTHQQPKQSLIDLELADYEKTIKTLRDDLTHKGKDVQEIRDELMAMTEKNLSLRKEIDSLEAQKRQTEERANKFQTLFETAKKDLQDAKDLEEERHYNDDNVRSLIDKLQRELDDCKASMSQLLSEKLQLTERLNHQSETTQRTINLLEQNLSIAKHDLDIARQDHDTLQDDFNNYKIRAQSVLKQNQSSQRERVPSVVDKQAEFEETIEKLKLTILDANNKIQLLISENEALQKEQDRLGDVQTKLINESRKREQDLRKQHQVEVDRIEHECSKRIDESEDLMKNLGVQNELLSSNFKEQLAAISADHERSVSMLQNQLQASKQEIEQLRGRIESLRQNNIDNEKESSQMSISNEASREDLPWAYAERQEGEGSESASVDYQATDVAVKTLENVLYGSTNSTRLLTSNSEKPRHILFEDVELERQRLEEELNKTKVRLLNTTELLNESELNNVRLIEQVSLLKDEIRRIERNMDRAESISNLEYLKNVIIKFLTLKSSPERSQLIPVLVTMLKLSPDEQAKLARIAQQSASSDEFSASSEPSSQQGNPSANSNPSSWTSYLNMW